MQVLTDEMVDALVAMGAVVDEGMRGRLLDRCGEGSSWSQMSNLMGTARCPNHGCSEDVLNVTCGDCGMEGLCWPYGDLIEEVASALWPELAPQFHGFPPNPAHIEEETPF